MPLDMIRVHQQLALRHDDDYAAWRDAKLARYPADPEQLIVEVADPRHLSEVEYSAIQERCSRANMALYVSATGTDPDKNIPRLLGERFGLHQLDDAPGADGDAITSVTVRCDASHQGLIPYTDRPIAWHTDGYYNTPERQIRAFTLHCVQAAATGGETCLIDPEMLYIRLRERDPAHIQALMRPQALSIPPDKTDGVEVRPRSTGPVFSVDEGRHLHMRYSDRRHNIDWDSAPDTAAAVAALREVLDAIDTPILRARLQPGWGFVCNNVLHRRGDFTDDNQAPRLLYRARYYTRVRGT
jgi:alpha-ketoglutarate-dependent taurine dioxygenase